MHPFRRWGGKKKCARPLFAAVHVAATWCQAPSVTYRVYSLCSQFVYIRYAVSSYIFVIYIYLIYIRLTLISSFNRRPPGAPLYI